MTFGHGFDYKFVRNYGELTCTKPCEYEDRFPGKIQLHSYGILTDLVSSRICWEQSMEAAIYSLRQMEPVSSRQLGIESQYLTW